MEINIVDDKVEGRDYEHSVNDVKGKESELLNVKDYFQIEVVDGETLFVCNVCNKGLDTEQEIAKHITNKPAAPAAGSDPPPNSSTTLSSTMQNHNKI